MEEQREKIINHLPLIQGEGIGLLLLYLHSRLQLSCLGPSSRSSLWSAQLQWVGRAVCTLLPTAVAQIPAPTHCHSPCAARMGKWEREKTQKPQNFGRGISLNIVSFKITLKTTAKK